MFKACSPALFLLLALLCGNEHLLAVKFEKECSSSKPVIKDNEGRLISIGPDTGSYAIMVADPGYVAGEPKLISIVNRSPASEVSAFILSAYDHNENLLGRWSARDDDGVRRRSSNIHARSVQCNERRGNVFVADEWPLEEIPSAVWTAPATSTDSRPISIRAVVVDRNGRAHHTDTYQLKPRSTQLLSVSLEECGTSKGCYLLPANCKARDCLYMLTWATIGDTVHFELSAAADGWVGIGFSDDDQLGNDQFVLCMQSPYQAGVQNHARLFNAYLPEGHDVPQLISEQEPLLGIDRTRLTAAYSNNHLTCSFSRPKAAVAGFGYKIKDLHRPHYILATFGSSANLNTAGMPQLSGQFKPHITDRRVDFNKEATNARLGSTGSWLAKVHGSLMVIAWVLLASIAMLTSRYYRPMWVTGNEGSRQGKYFWISVYQPLILSVAILSVIALIFILFELNWTWPTMQRYIWHSALGISVIILSIINVALSFCIPRYNGRGYCIWFWIHWIVSSLAHCLAIPVIFLGMDQPKLDLWDWCSWLLLAWCIFHILTDLILEIHYCMTYRKSYERFEEVPSYHGDNNLKRRSGSWRSGRNPPGYKWKPFCLGLYVFVTAAVVAALVIAIIVYDW